MTSHIVVPARLSSTRLPRKPLADIHGKPMIVRVMERAVAVDCHSVVAAVDDESVYAVVKQAGYEAEMTSVDHPSGSDRVMEVAERRGWANDDVVVNVQGDEPLFPTPVVNGLIQSMAGGDDLATVAEPITSVEDFENSNIVKVVTGADGRALYFSRAPIPHVRDPAAAEEALRLARRHVGIYAFTVHALRRFTQIKDAELEKAEMLEQLRWLEAGHSIRILQADEPVPGGVDTPADLDRVRQVFASLDERSG